MICNKCGKEIPIDSDFCPECVDEIEQETQVCDRQPNPQLPIDTAPVKPPSETAGKIIILTVIIIIVLLLIVAGTLFAGKESKPAGTTTTTEPISNSDTDETISPTASSVENAKPNATTNGVTATLTTIEDAIATEESSQQNAVERAKSYLEYSSFSHKSLIKQLEYEGFSRQDAVYGADNCNADWKEQAIKRAQWHLDFGEFAYKDLIRQLEYEGFSHEDAVYGVENCGSNW